MTTKNLDELRAMRPRMAEAARGADEPAEAVAAVLASTGFLTGAITDDFTDEPEDFVVVSLAEGVFTIDAHPEDATPGNIGLARLGPPLSDEEFSSSYGDVGWAPDHR